MDIAIIGAGMAGLSCADSLVAAGHRVTLFDKGRGPGGRMSTRRLETPLGEAGFDHGAQYFTVRHPQFRALVERWEKGGVARPWAEAGSEAWVGVPGMNAVIRAMAAVHAVRYNSHVGGILAGADGWHLAVTGTTPGPFDAVVVALPAEQAAPLLALHDLGMARRATQARSQPCWTAMFAFAAPLPAPGDAIRDAGIISWAARNSAKPGRTGPEAWVVQAGPVWSAAHLEDQPDTVAAALLGALATALGTDLPAPVASSAHRWRFAMSSGTGLGALWNPALRIGACGDWLIGPRVECAWQSGALLGQVIAEQASAEPSLAK